MSTVNVSLPESRGPYLWDVRSYSWQRTRHEERRIPERLPSPSDHSSPLTGVRFMGDAWPTTRHTKGTSCGWLGVSSGSVINVPMGVKCLVPSYRVFPTTWTGPVCRSTPRLGTDFWNRGTVVATVSGVSVCLDRNLGPRLSIDWDTRTCATSWWDSGVLRVNGSLYPDHFGW